MKTFRIAALVLMVPMGVGAQTASADVYIDGDAGPFYSPCRDENPFFTADAACGNASGSLYGEATATQFYTGSSGGATIWATNADPSDQITTFSWSGGLWDNITITGPVTPANFVFYDSFASTNGITGNVNATGSAYYFWGCQVFGASTPLSLFTCTQPAGLGLNMIAQPFQASVGMGAVDPTHTYSGVGSWFGTGTLVGLDIVDSTGHSLLGIDQISAAYGTYMYGNPNPLTTAPEPSTLVLLGTGLVGLLPVVRRWRGQLHASRSVPQ